MLSSNTRTEGVAAAGGGLAHDGYHGRAHGGYHGHADGRPANRGLADGADQDRHHGCADDAHHGYTDGINPGSSHHSIYQYQHQHQYIYGGDDFSQELIRCGQYLTPQALVRPGVRIH